MPPFYLSEERCTSKCTEPQWGPHCLWLSPNLVMEDVKERALESFPSPPPPPPTHTHFWNCYVDDIFTALPKTLITPFLDHLNGIEPSIKFTVVEERDGQLAFLDVLLRKEDDGTINTSVLHKATCINQYLSFMSHHLTAHKVASSCQNSDDQSRELVFLRCGADRKREVCHRCTERQ